MSGASAAPGLRGAREQHCYLTHYLSEESQVLSVGDTRISGIEAVGPTGEEAADAAGSGGGPPAAGS